MQNWIFRWIARSASWVGLPLLSIFIYRAPIETCRAVHQVQNKLPYKQDYAPEPAITVA